MQRLPTHTIRMLLIALLGALAVASAHAEPIAGPIDEASTPLGRAATSEDQPIGESTASGMGVLRTLGALGVVSGLAIAAWFGARVLAKAQGGLASMLGPGGRAPSGLLEVLGRYPVGRGQTLVLLKIDRRVLLLSQSSTGRLGTSSTFSTLTEITDPEEVASILVKSRDDDSSSSSEKFTSMLGRFERDYEPPFDAGGRDIPVVDLTGADRSSPVLANIRKRIGARGGAA